jgi:ATP-dependent RNA helicase DDX18/HAS1
MEVPRKEKQKNKQKSKHVMEDVQVENEQEETVLPVETVKLQSADDHNQKKKKKDKKRKRVDEEVEEQQALEEDHGDIDHTKAEPATEDQESAVIPSNLFSTQLFSSLPLSPNTQQALQQMGFTSMTLIQSRSIPECLAGNDLVGAAKTGSGKTLAFLIPIVELLHRIQFTRQQGTGAIVISPTRELSLQIYGVLRDIIEYGHFQQTHGLIMGGANRKAEADKLSKGVNILICTPGRLHDHLANTKGFIVSRLQMLVIDEADRILEQGFEEDMKQIIALLPKQRQTLLFSATQTRKVEDLARLSMRENPIYTGVHDDAKQATVDNLLQGYVVCPAQKRFLLLYSFLKKNKNKKIMVRFSIIIK